jgi:DNA-directed RNA polymerase sigma subunit (sigma70/sigma32)
MAYKIRRDEIKRMRKEGKTLSEIGKKYKITRERVRQILLEKD